MLAGRPTPSEEIAAHLRLEAKVSAVRAAYRLLDVDVTEIARGLELLASARHNLEDDGTSLRADLLRLIPRLKERLESLPRDESAEAAYQLLMLEQWVDRGTDNGQSRRDAYLARYAGTARAVLMQLLADAPREPLAKQEFVDHTRTLASEHEGTPRGVAALYALAIWQIDRARADADPSIALLEVFDILKRMERAHLQAEWEESVRRMLREFRFRAAINVAPPAGMERLYSAYLDFIVAHRSEVWLIRHTVSRFASREFERIPTVERFFADLEARNFGIDATRYQRAEFYRSFMDPDRSTEGDPRIDQQDAERLVRESLAALSRSADAVWRARAVAAAAALDFSLGRYADARAGYAAYITEFPDNDYAWIAAIRAAQSRETLGDTPGAAADFEAAMERFKDRPYAKVLAGIAAANIREAAGDLAGALRNYRAATEAWANVPDRWWLDALPQRVIDVDALQGADLDAGTFPTNAARLSGQTQPFSVDTLALELESRTTTGFASYGVTDRLAIGATVPLTTVRFRGTRTRNERGVASLQARESGSSTGFGDITLNARYLVAGDGPRGVSVWTDLRLPTGREEDLLGSGKTAARFLGIGSWEDGKLAVNVNGGYGVGGASPSKT